MPGYKPQTRQMKTCSGHLWRAVIFVFLAIWKCLSFRRESRESRAEHTGDTILGQGVVKMPTFMWRAGQRVTWILVEEEDNETEGVMYAPSNVHTLRIMSTTNCRHHAVSAPFDCTWGMATFSSLSFPALKLQLLQQTQGWQWPNMFWGELEKHCPDCMRLSLCGTCGIETSMSCMCPSIVHLCTVWKQGAFPKIAWSNASSQASCH